MGNENSSLVKIRRSSKDKEPNVIIECVDAGSDLPVYRKKSRRRSISQSRPTSINSSSPTPPIPRLLQTTQISIEEVTNNNNNINNSNYFVGSRKSSVSNFRLSSDGSGDSLLSPLSSLVNDRRRSRSLCSAQMKDDAQAVASHHNSRERGDSATPTTTEKEKGGGGGGGGTAGGGRKISTGLVPSLNRLRIQQCYKTAKPSIGDSIMKRAAASRAEMRTLLSKMNEKQIECLGRQMYELISNAVENADKSEKVLTHARQFGETYASLVPLGFRPDLFAPLADAAIAECVKLDGVHKRCETLSAWSQLFSALFTGVRDGYYQRVRHQRRTSLPQNTITKQLSVDFSKSADQHQFVR